MGVCSSICHQNGTNSPASSESAQDQTRFGLTTVRFARQLADMERYAQSVPPLVLPWISTAWFGLASASCGVVGFNLGLGLGMASSFEDTARIVVALAVSGALSSWVFRKPLHKVATGRRWFLSSFLGLVVALLALEMAVAISIVLVEGSISSWFPLAAWVFAPLLAAPVLLVAGPLSGLVFVAITRPVVRITGQQAGAQYPTKAQAARSMSSRLGRNAASSGGE